LSTSLRVMEETGGLDATQTVVVAMAGIARLLDAGGYDDAEAALRELSGQARRDLGFRHPVTLAVEYNLAELLIHQERVDAASAMLPGLVERYIAVLGIVHPETLDCVTAWSELLLRTGEYDVAEPALRAAYAASQEHLPPDHDTRIILLFSLTKSVELNAVRERDMEKVREASGLYDELINILTVKTSATNHLVMSMQAARKRLTIPGPSYQQ
jgi:tetratricopeptide (TPR) repeat protein